VAADVIAAGDDAPYYSVRSDFFFQVVFVATAMSIVSGAVAERMKLWSFLLFAAVFCAVIYPDFAGSGVVHMCGAAAALAGVLLLGSRKGKYGPNGEVQPIPGANMPLATLGTFILWMGWFGFNGGSELKVSNFDEANAVAQIFVNTNMAAAGGVVATAGMATLVGAIGGVLVVVAIITLDRLRIDDPVGAISVHGVVGIFGLLAVAFTNPEATLAAQGYGIAVIFGWTFTASLVLWGILKLIVGIRISEEEEYSGADMAECMITLTPTG